MDLGSHPNADEAEAEWSVIAVARVVRLQSPAPLWKIASTEFSVFYTDSMRMAELAQRAHDEMRLLHIESVPDERGSQRMRTIAVTEAQPALACSLAEEAGTPMPGCLF